MNPRAAVAAAILKSIEKPPTIRKYGRKKCSRKGTTKK
jgi:hypothetical protein